MISLMQALKKLPREEVQLATKFGIVKIEADNLVIKGTPEYVRSCCESSLERLGVEYIDLYYVHRIDTSIPIEETVSLFSNFSCSSMIVDALNGL